MQLLVVVTDRLARLVGERDPELAGEEVRVNDDGNKSNPEI